VVSVLVVAALVFGIVILADETNSIWVAVGVAAFALLATVPAVGRWVLHVACAGAVALIVLVAVAALIRLGLDLVGVEGRIPIPLGLVLALAVFWIVAYWYLHGDWPRTPLTHIRIPSPGWRVATAALGATGLALAVILGLPLAFALVAKDTKDVPGRRPVVSKIDALIVSAAPRAAASAPAAAPAEPYAGSAGFDVSYSVGFAEGDGVRWTLTGSDDPERAISALTEPGAQAVPPPAPVNDADRVLLLVVDGTAPVPAESAALPNVPGTPGEVERWRRIARASAPSGTPSYALLESGSRARLHDWSRFIRRGTHVRRGRAVSVQRFAPSSMPDAAVQLAVGSPTSQEDYVLALRHQPILLFHSTEPVPRPLSVGALLQGGKMKQCFTRRVAGEKCAVVRNPNELENGGTHLELSLPSSRALRRLAADEQRALESEAAGAKAPGALPPVSSRPLGEGSAMYVHSVPTESEDSSMLYLDYWWYLPDNPAGSGSGAFCGPGLVIPGISCFDHQSDWEGVTVVLDRTVPGRAPKPVAVHYAQHSAVSRYDWADLTGAWTQDASLARLRASTPGGAARPLVFVARGTHAAYPLPCPRLRPCTQVAADLDENPHDGKLGWAGNSVACGTHPCLSLLPTALGGRAPALWNAFEGAWGERHCFLTYYCDSASPPAAPGRQGRYRRPWEDDGTFKP
jgi:hypothetical protein